MIPPNQIHLALRHDKVMGRENKTIHTSVTQIDLHDFCRLSFTYGLGGFHCITEIEAQHRITQDILEYWQKGFGKDYNPDRVQALGSLHLHRGFDPMLEWFEAEHGVVPLLFATSAKAHHKTLDFESCSNIIERSGRPTVIQFGTGWGLSSEQLNRCDGVLPPIDGHDGYNHLSVRCAAAILIDRFFFRHIETQWR